MPPEKSEEGPKLDDATMQQIEERVRKRLANENMSDDEKHAREIIRDEISESLPGLIRAELEAFFKGTTKESKPGETGGGFLRGILGERSA